MSTKTLRKRVALATVAALGAGVLSLVSIPAANAAETATLAVNANGTTGSSATASVGLLTGAVSAVKSTTMTSTLLATGGISLTVASANGASDVVVTGGYIAAAATTDYISADATTATDATGGFSVLVKPNSGVTSFTVQLFDNATLSSGVITTQGNLSSQIVVTVASSSASGVFSAAKSLINTAASTSDSTNAGIDIANTNSGSTTTILNGDKARVNFDLRDAYDSALGTGAIVATAVGGYVDLGGASPSATSDVGTDPSTYYTVAQSTANTAASVTVTLSYQGTVVSTRTFKFLGEVAKVTVSNPRVVGVSETAPTTTAASAFTARYYDAAGNELWPSDQTSATTLVSGLGGQIVSAATINTAGADGNASHPYAVGAVTGSKAGSTDLQLQYVNATSGTIIKSNTWTQYVAGDAYSYTAKLDKSTYKPGEIATLTITFKDADGNLANHLANKITDSSTGNLITYVGNPGTVVTAAASTDVAGGGTDAAGTKTYQFTVGTTTGSLNMIVSAPVVNAKGGANQTVAYTIADGSTSLNDVLKGIVSLIASINKQIAALAKLVTKKK